MVPRETRNNACAKSWSEKQTKSIMVFLILFNSFTTWWKLNVHDLRFKGVR